MLRLFGIKAPPPRMLKQWWCCAWQIRNKQHLRRRVEFEWVKTRCRDSFMQMKTEGRRGEASFSIHEVSWPFACQARAVCVCMCICVCVYVRETATSNTPEANTHIVHSNCLREERGVWGDECVCLYTNTHTNEHKWCPCGGWGVLSSLGGRCSV